MAFGRRKVPFGEDSTPPVQAVAVQAVAVQAMAVPVDSDGKRRVFGEAIHAVHGEMLEKLGFGLNSARNIRPDKAELDRRAQRSFDLSVERHRDHNAELLARYGCAGTQPFFLFPKTLFGTELGAWLILSMNLLPFDSWNVIYLPTDERTARALGLPLHPGRPFFDFGTVITDKIGPIHHALAVHHASVGRAFAESHDFNLLQDFRKNHDLGRAAIIDFAQKVMAPRVIRALAETQGKAASHAATSSDPRAG